MFIVAKRLDVSRCHLVRRCLGPGHVVSDGNPAPSPRWDIVLGIDSEIRLFADDCIVYRQIRNSCDSVTNCMNGQTNGRCIKVLNTFNVSKCCILSIHHKRTPPTLNYTLGNKTYLAECGKLPFLPWCYCLYSDLRWHEHVNNVSVKATKTLNFIRRNVYCCPADIKATAYISLVRPRLEYAVAAWDQYLVGDCKQLEKVQRRAARFVKRDYKSTTSVSSLISQLGWRTLSDHRINNRLSLM